MGGNSTEADNNSFVHRLQWFGSRVHCATINNFNVM